MRVSTVKVYKIAVYFYLNKRYRKSDCFFFSARNRITIMNKFKLDFDEAVMNSNSVSIGGETFQSRLPGNVAVKCAFVRQCERPKTRK